MNQPVSFRERAELAETALEEQQKALEELQAELEEAEDKLASIRSIVAPELDERDERLDWMEEAMATLLKKQIGPLGESAPEIEQLLLKRPGKES